jgi:DNA-binding LacI/PurR family transcriptional regulator
VGFDDSRLASLLRPALSTVRVPLSEVGAEVIAALILRIREPEAPVVSRTLPTRLVIRESSRV